MKKIFLTLLSFFLVSNTFADSEVKPSLWSINAGMGYTKYNNMLDSDGQTAFARLAIDKIFLTRNNYIFGLELGFQTGNAMKLAISSIAMDTLGGVPINTTVKNFLDLLISMEQAEISRFRIMPTIKAGIAWQRLQINDRDTVNNLSQLNGEIQVGFYYHIAPKLSLGLFYQGIFGGSINFTVDDNLLIGHISNIPVQNSILLNIKINFEQ